MAALKGWDVGFDFIQKDQIKKQWKCGLYFGPPHPPMAIGCTYLSRHVNHLI